MKNFTDKDIKNLTWPDVRSAAHEICHPSHNYAKLPKGKKRDTAIHLVEKCRDWRQSINGGTDAGNVASTANCARKNPEEYRKRFAENAIKL